MDKLASVLTDFSSGKIFVHPNSSHFSIVDKEGNAVSMTTSVEFAFGSWVMVDGLNESVLNLLSLKNGTRSASSANYYGCI
ncbi:gamma-glutamyltranspeptidase [Paraglaciecola psychrophila 170]|uniref:Gamma-glutamyltranspeptidase n=1 Tax=Paraglaciecola psychrophila 170 TaxID=1129794 RepID=M4RSA0_9ALTE|nr:gamma-glutamyltransferase [Paraglaciecola psychrophila]AGH45084.1 gamma-glutamyltranspeptidase [Paraglaciecola psychrophila 170]